MKRFIEGESRNQITLMPACLDDYIDTDNPVRVIDLFVDELDLAELGFEGTTAAHTGWPGYHPALLLEIYIYGYLNQIQTSLKLERETQRNVELMWLTGQLSPDFKTIADFRHDNGKGIRNVGKERSPVFFRLPIEPILIIPPELCWQGVRPVHAAASLPDWK